METVGQFSGPGCVVGGAFRPSGLNHYPGLHQLISGFNKPTREANRVGFGFRSMATLECPNGKTFRPQIIDLWVIGIMLTVNTKKAFFPWNHRNFASPEIIVFCSNPIGACCMLSGRFQGFIPPKWAHFHDHILSIQPADRSRVPALGTRKTAPIENFPVLEVFRSRNLSVFLRYRGIAFPADSARYRGSKKTHFPQFFGPCSLIGKKATKNSYNKHG
jgi:hypothetical protein